MNRTIAVGALAGAAAVALAVGSATFSAPDGAADLGPQRVGAGVLALTLDAAGRADTTLSFGDLMPGRSSSELFWVAGDDTSSTENGVLSMTVHGLHDHAGPCDISADKARAELAAGVSGCTLTGGVLAGRPTRGNLSRVLAVDIGYARTTASACTARGATSTLVVGAPGNLRALNGATVRFVEAGAPLVLTPGAGVCVQVTASWPTIAASADRPADNAAEGDSLTVAVRFDLVQVPS